MLPRLILLVLPVAVCQAYDNFKAVIYCPVLDVEAMAEGDYLESSYALLEKYMDIDKVYLETHRRHHLIEAEQLEKVKRFFRDRGVTVSGGITTTGEPAITGRFGLFCYTSDSDRKWFEEVVRFTARHFDELILDDFYFTDCRCENCIAAKGDRSWPEFRTELMAEVSRNLVVKPAREENPDINLIIKYPNWYDFYQYTGYNLKDQPGIFDMVYTGTETRDPVFHQQHLQPYQGYLIMRYLENVAPGRNGGGWVDPLDMGTLNRYGEQLLLTLIAGAEEMMLFRWGSLMEVVRDAAGNKQLIGMNAAVAGSVFDKADLFLGRLGNPVGLKTYKPVNSAGEPFLPAWLGMLGIPVELVPEFPEGEGTVLLTEASAFDPDIVDRMKKHLSSGNDIVMTSGLLRALRGKGIEEITTISWTEGKVQAGAYTDLGFGQLYPAAEKALFPLIAFPTNDAWMEITAISGDNSFPLLTQSEYAGGLLRVLSIPDDFADLYKIPEGALSLLRERILETHPVRLEAPAKVGLFTFDNHTCLVHSFLPHESRIRLRFAETSANPVDMLSGRELRLEQDAGGGYVELHLPPYSYRVVSWTVD